MKMDLSDKIILIIISISVLIVIVATGYKFLAVRDYNFYVEVNCNPESETCFYRDCSEESNCPPNQLENYRTLIVRANDFYNCADSSCAAECASGAMECTEVVCDSNNGYECSTPVPNGDVEIQSEQNKLQKQGISPADTSTMETLPVVY